jgi:hypothetical protein
MEVTIEIVKTIAIVILLGVIGVPTLKALGFIFNPFWMFTNYKRIKNNDKRVSDFYNTTHSNMRDNLTSLHISEIPKPELNYIIAKEEKPK